MNYCRPVRAWIQSLDEFRRLEPEYLVPSHTSPLVGKDVVAKQLTDYRDGISWVYVSTIRVGYGYASQPKLKQIRIVQDWQQQQLMTQLWTTKMVLPSHLT